jgi:hypothetical protein
LTFIPQNCRENGIDLEELQKRILVFLQISDIEVHQHAFMPHNQEDDIKSIHSSEMAKNKS